EIISFFFFFLKEPATAKIYTSGSAAGVSCVKETDLDPPMMMKPFILIDEGLIILSKHLLRASLSSLVPTLLKDKHGSSYKDRFAKVMESY
ncbi:hypothetical protein MUU52_27570, partial [Klebsiella pneumoniae]|nr:hypothetical protein [Klebsiella pneumoniae]